MTETPRRSDRDWDRADAWLSFGSLLVIFVAALSASIIADRVPARLQLQVHKIIWAPDTRGV